jgi:endonuclease YncB( thermonuclease family)
MKKIITALLVVLAMMVSAHAQKPSKGVTYDTQILRVSDGDTVVISAKFLPAPLKPELAVRIFGVDTPEKGSRAKCDSENQRGLAASAFTKIAVAQSTQQQVTLYAWDKFGGRVLGDILLDGRSLRAMLIENGHARAYFGEAKQSWCP